MSLSYRNQTDEGRRNTAASRKCQCLQNIHKDEDSHLGPPDKRGHFCGKEKHLQIGHRVEVKYDDSVWYAGTLTEFNATTGKCVAVFDKDLKLIITAENFFSGSQFHLGKM